MQGALAGYRVSSAYSALIKLYLQEKERKRKRKEASKSKSKKHKHKKVLSITFDIMPSHRLPRILCSSIPLHASEVSQMLACTQYKTQHLAETGAFGCRTRRANTRSTAARSDEEKAVVLNELSDKSCAKHSLLNN